MSFILWFCLILSSLLAGLSCAPVAVSKSSISVSLSYSPPHPLWEPAGANNISLHFECFSVCCTLPSASFIVLVVSSCLIFLTISFFPLSSAYSHVVENTAFFGDVALRFPRIVHHYYDRNSDWGGLLRWGLNFCNQTGVFTGGAHQHVLTLVRPDNQLSYAFADHWNLLQQKCKKNIFFLSTVKALFDWLHLIWHLHSAEMQCWCCN